jgi:DDE superfamily endonuclease
LWIALSNPVKGPKIKKSAKSCIQDINTTIHQKIFIVLPKSEDIIDVKIGKPGPTSDINIFREIQDKFNKDQKFKGDKAFIGGQNISTPHKKPKNKELTEQQNLENKEFSGQRVFVEHTIRLVKIFRISEQKFRLRSHHYKRVVRAVCGLVRLRIGAFIL